MRPKTLRAVTVLVAIALTVGNANGQEAEATSVAAKSAAAVAAFDAKDWPAAAKLYQQVIDAAPNPRAWYRLGVALRNIGELDKAVLAFENAATAGAPPFQSEFGIATAHAMRKDSEKALLHLKRAVDAGFNMPDQLKSEPSLALLSGDPKFAAIVEQATRNQKPCAYKAENRQFDFWVGEWDVVLANGGGTAGQSRIELILADCVVLENWQSASSLYSGKSYNTYNAAQKRWEQYWVDNIGGRIFFAGALKDGVMDYYTDDMDQPDGTKIRRHLQFFKLGPDTVRQFSQMSKDGGKSWTVEYDFIYNRKK